MIAVCYQKSPKKYVIRQGRREFHNLSDGSEVAELIPEICLEFIPVAGGREARDTFSDPSFMPGDNPRRDSAEVAGTLGVEQEAEKVGLTADELVFWMLHDPSYNTSVGFIVRRDDGTRVLGLDDWIVEPVEGAQAGVVNCRACEQELHSRGLLNHLGSKGHKAAFDEFKNRLRDRILLLGRQRKESDTVAYLG